jgi:hypothetical protein
MTGVRPGLFYIVLLLEFFHAAGGIDDFLLLGIEGMAIRANFHMEVLHG